MSRTIMISKDTDPRGPLRTVKSVTSDPTQHSVTFVECDHVASLTRHFAPPEAGRKVRCLHCREGRS